MLLGFCCGQSYLKSLEDTTIVAVSHDRAFLDAVATEIIVFRHKRLAYHAGNYSGGGFVLRPCKQAIILVLLGNSHAFYWALSYVPCKQAIANLLLGNSCA